MRVVRFTAAWCADCIVMKAVWSKWLPEINNLELIDYDFDDNQAEAQKFDVKRLPLVILFDRDGQQIARLEGMQDLDTLQKILTK